MRNEKNLEMVNGNWDFSFSAYLIKPSKMTRMVILTIIPSMDLKGQNDQNGRIAKLLTYKEMFQMTKILTTLINLMKITCQELT